MVKRGKFLPGDRVLVAETGEVGTIKAKVKQSDEEPEPGRIDQTQEFWYCVNLDERGEVNFPQSKLEPT